MIRLTALLLTVFTGFAGLVYEVTWQRYLATLLGSHSEATAAVLGIYLGGLALGYWLFGRVTRRLVARAEAQRTAPRLLLFYGLLEAGIGAYALVFPLLFRAVQTLSYAVPHGAAGVGFAFDVVLCVLLIGLPTVLMGGTIPILTQALSRNLDDATRFHAFVYGFNTVGAFAGALVAGFYLVPVLGLVRVMLAMSAINLVAGGSFVLLGLRGRTVEASVAEPTPAATGFASYAVVALLVGFAMMALQTIAIRLAGISFGSSQYTFSMVVAVFVLCIAIGSFGVSLFPRIRTSVVVGNQWLLALLFLILYFPLPQSPYLVYVLRTLFSNESAAFYGFYFLGFLAVLGVFGAPVILSGAALPLLFHHLRRQVGHLGDIAGTLYSWNTVGSLLGALLAGYALLFWLDLHHVYRIAIAALVLAATLLTVSAYALPRAVGLVAVPLLALLVMLTGWNPKIFTLGLARMPRVLPGTYEGIDTFLRENSFLVELPILFHDDDPTSSVTVREHAIGTRVPALSLWTDGRGDGNTVIGAASPRLLGILPAMLADQAERAFVIGFGVGTTAGELGAIDSMREVTVAEISPGVVRAAPIFEHANLGPLTNPKVQVIRSDAYRALMRSEGRFDVIASQPSHLWVAGSEMVISREFLEAARNRLNPGGVYAQWLQRGQVDDATVALVLRTYAAVFEHVSVWVPLGGELLLLGFDSEGPGIDHYRLAERAERADFAAALKRANIDSAAELLAHEVLPVGVLHAANLQGPIHTLLHPRLNYVAARGFFQKKNGSLPFTGFADAARVGASHSLLRGYLARFGGRLPGDEHAALVVGVCDYEPQVCVALLADWQRQDPDSPAFQAALPGILQRLAAHGEVLPEGALERMAALLPGKSAAPSATVTPEYAKAASMDFARYYHHALPFDGRQLLDVWSRCRVGVPSEEFCRNAAKARRNDQPFIDDTLLEQFVEQCRTASTSGQICQDGAARARRLVEHGEAEGLE